MYGISTCLSCTYFHCKFIAVLFSTRALRMWNIQYTLTDRSSPISPFPVCSTLFCVIRCYSHSYLFAFSFCMVFARACAAHVLHWTFLAISFSSRYLAALATFQNSTCILHLAHSAWLVVFWCTFFFYIYHRPFDFLHNCLVFKVFA
jgi:hypothetical protein